MNRHGTLLLAPEIFASEGGITRILQLYLRALCDSAESDRAVRLVALNDSTIPSYVLERHGVQRLEEAVACAGSRGTFVRAALRLSRVTDLIVCGHIAQAPAAWLARKLNPSLRYVIIAHGIEVWRNFTAAERLALRGAARVLCVSEFTRNELLRRCPLPGIRTIVVPNALGPTFPIMAGESLARCAPVILSATRLAHADRYKGVDHLIAALPEMRRTIPDVTLRIVGRGDDRPRLEALRNELGLGDAVQFLGYVPDEQLAREMRRCRLFALPSAKEGFGLVFLEAMAAGRPCLGARAGGIPEVISEETGILVEAGDVPAIATAAVAALRRTWDESAILSRARLFAYPTFRDRLREITRALPVVDAPISVAAAVEVSR